MKKSFRHECHCEGVSPQKLYNCQNKWAFTLAEVLITLGIIGIVAAMTLPALVGNYQKNVAVNKLQKVYNILSNAIRRAEADHGEYKDWEDGSTAGIGAEAYFNKYWKPYIKVLKVCDTFQECNYKDLHPFLQADGSMHGTDFIRRNYRVPFIVADGVMINVLTGGDGGSNESIIVDINGGNLPNKMGRDVFMFIRVSGKGIVPWGYDRSPEDIDENCSKNGSGEACSAKMMKDGWQIKSDYPW